MASMTGPPPNDANLGSRTIQDQFIGVLIAGLILDLCAVGLRLYARRKWDAGIGKDDALVVAALAPLFAYVVSSLSNVYHTRADPMVQGPSKRFIVSFLVCIIAYAVNTMLVKLSIMAFYCRLFRSKGLIQLAWAVAVFVVLFNIALILVAALQCIPLSAAWTDKPGTCINLNTPLLVLGIVNVLVDFAILAIPMRVVLRLNMNSSRKLQVCAVFLTGAIVGVFSILRVTAVTRVTPHNRIYAETWSGLVSFCEMFVGIIAACLPTFGRFFSKDNIQSVASHSRRISSRVWPRNRESQTHVVDMQDTRPKRISADTSSSLLKQNSCKVHELELLYDDIA